MWHRPSWPEGPEHDSWVIGWLIGVAPDDSIAPSLGFTRVADRWRDERPVSQRSQHSLDFSLEFAFAFYNSFSMFCSNSRIYSTFSLGLKWDIYCNWMHWLLKSREQVSYGSHLRRVLQLIHSSLAMSTTVEPSKPLNGVSVVLLEDNRSEDEPWVTSIRITEQRIIGLTDDYWIQIRFEDTIRRLVANTQQI